MRRDDLKRTIMELLNRTEMHGYEVYKQLESKGIRLHLSYLYRVLAEMEKEDCIKSTQIRSKLGPEKKVYRLCDKGAKELDQTLKEAVRTIHIRYMDYLMRLPPQKSIVKKIQLLLDVPAGKGRKGEKVLVVAPEIFYDWMISHLCTNLHDGNVYLIKPHSIKVNIGFENLEVLDTPLENILLKDNFVNAVRVHGEPKDFPRALKEFHRVLKRDGSLELIIPYFHSHRDNSPMTLAEFVEKKEHEISKEGKTELDYTTARSLLLKYFRKVRCHRLAHLAIFIAKSKI